MALHFAAARRPVRPVAKSTDEHLLMLRASVAADGGEALFRVQFTNQQPFRAVLGAAEFPVWFAEIRRAAALLADRQRLSLDRGRQRLLDICHAAPLAMCTNVVVDPATADHIMVFQFADHAPFAVRVALAEVPLIATELANGAAAVLH